MKTLAWPMLGAAILLVATVAAGAAWGGSQQAAGADNGVVTTLAIDMDPKDGTGSYVNDDHTVGTIDPCIEVAAGGTVEFDVVLDAIPAGVGASALKGYQYFMGFDENSLTFTAQSHTTAGVNIIARHPNSCSGILECLDTGEGVPDPPDSGSPAAPGVHDVFVAESTSLMEDGVTAGSCGGGKDDDGDTLIDGADPDCKLVGGPGDPWGLAGGVLGRYSITVSDAAPAGVYGIGLNSSITYVTVLNDSAAKPIWDLPGNGIDDDGDGAVDEDLMLDATADHGRIAVDVSCAGGPPAPTATPSPTASPVPSGTPSPPGTPSPSPSPAPPPGPQQTDMAAGWNNLCYLSAAQPIDEALADIKASVLAVYRLKAGQGWDTWFPGEPTASTIDTLAPYDPLFILMASSASWAQQGQASPPMVMNLPQGWSNICYTGQTKDPASATSAIEGEFAVLYVLGPNQSWQQFVPATPQASSLSQVVHLEPVLILVTQAGGSQWTFDP